MPAALLERHIHQKITLQILSLNISILVYKYNNLATIALNTIVCKYNYSKNTSYLFIPLTT